MHSRQEICHSYRQRYPNNWSDIALVVKEAASWRCRHCGKQCLRPGEKPKDLTRSERAIATLTVHHANFTPEDNRPENLIALCAPCHLAVHQPRRGNVSPGQLSLFSLKRENKRAPGLTVWHSWRSHANCLC